MEKDVFSVLNMHSLSFELINFERDFSSEKSDDLNSSISRDTAEEVDGISPIRLSVNLVKKGDFSITVRLVGHFSVGEDCDAELKKELLDNNAVAIMMPFVRAQIQLLTSQPDMQPVILPILDVSKMFKDK